MNYRKFNHLLIFLFSILLTVSCAKDEDLFVQAVNQSVQEEIDKQDETSSEEESPGNNQEEDTANNDSAAGDTGKASELKAFPSAIGAGAFITGGRGNEVYHVTNLNDSGEGSFREAVSSSNRIVVFDVSGVIKLTSRLISSANNITIAGQTAPTGGITLDGETFMLSQANNWIIRYIRFRGGYASSTIYDSFGATDCDGVYLDHCSMSFGTDESGSITVSSGGGSEFGGSTMAHCLLGESKTGTIFKGTKGMTSYLNLYYNISHRFPNIADNGGVGYFDIINNVVWNYKNRLVRGNDEVNVLHIGNYADIGSTPMRNERINQYQYTGSIPTIYTSGNIIKAQSSQSPNAYTVDEMNEDNKLMWSFFDGTRSPYIEDERLPMEWFATKQRSFLGAEPEVFSAEQALSYVANDVGANKTLNSNGSFSNNSDTLDTEWLLNVKAGIYTSSMEFSEYSVPSIQSIVRPSGFDTDNDGMPNEWEIIMGFNPEVDDSKGDHDGDGYTNIEEYLNLVDF